MAKQIGIIKTQGTIDDLTFSKTKDGYIVKKRTSLDGTKINSDPNFQRTRENNSELAKQQEQVSSYAMRSARRYKMQKTFVLYHDSQKK
jgi:hypothetical protein